MLEKLKKKNPNIEMYSVDSSEFAPYGRVINGLDIAEIINVAETIEMPENGSVYMPYLVAFETLPIAAEIRDMLYGEMNTQKHVL